LSSWILGRLASGLLLLWAAATLVFLVGEAIPGDPFSLEEGVAGDPHRAQELRRRYGLDRPLPERYVAWLGGAVRGDWGVSLRARRPVVELLAAAMPVSARLGGAALALALGAGLFLGVAGATLHERGGAAAAAERRIDQAALAAYCMPTFWVGLGLVEVFSYKLGWLPPSHLQPVGGGLVGSPGAWRHWILPVLTLAIVPAAAIGRHLRSSLLEARAEGFLDAARARGAGAAALLLRHRLRACLGPALAVAALHLPHLAGGALLVEVVFALPGMGRLAYAAALGRDYPLLLAATLLASAAVVTGSLAADLLQAWADPRLRGREAKP
jgi:ABC-type dipeptide/oligopeptide/nickel transport system permease component